MSSPATIPRVLEKHYSLQELAWLIGFSKKFWAQKCKAGELTVKDAAGTVLEEPREISGEIMVPASCANAFLAKHPYRYDAGVKARNTGELRRRLAATPRAEVFCG